MVEKLFKVAISHNANDIHLSEGIPPTLRIGGRMVRMQADPLTADDIERVMRALTPPRCMVELSKNGYTDFGYDFGDNRFRIAVFRQRGGIGIVMRNFRNVMFSLDELQIPQEVRAAMVHDRGLFIITGPTGSGKTTTMATLIDHINSNCNKHIITIEDPIEIIHQHKLCNVSQREIGVDVFTFADGVRCSMRHDPDVIVVGEMRDVETIRIALKAAETGHLVLGTLHARTASAVVTRIIAEFASDEQDFIRMQLSSSLLGVINQVLIPTTDGKGVASVMEILMNSPSVASLIRQGKENQIIDEIRKGKSLGMVSFEESLRQRCVNKDVDWREATRYSREPETFKTRMEKK
ncbi:MAG: PilT/PilU family type 4a pilus ATPase [Proteobacteria bacterium]|nr:PilT/PilU family type 4a pilus ATPase [Pseudomonadota bacterium]MBU0965551.1 PilT/PilU family type 4a pilus ATPase [Pseudomonadota bacterium]